MDGRWASLGRFLPGVETRIVGEGTLRALEQAVRVTSELPVPAPVAFRPAPEPEEADVEALT